MELPGNFIKATDRYNELESPVAAPFFRRVFELDRSDKGGPGIWNGELWICGLGFYMLHINGREITKGALAPYISNPDSIVYYDRYDISPFLRDGGNVIGVCLGNGFFNNPGGHIWDFDKALWRGPLRFALRAEIRFSQQHDDVMVIEGSDGFMAASSPILSDDYRCGEIYDARLEIPGWDDDPQMDVSGWRPAVRAESPRGEKRLCEVEPIVVGEVLKPVHITPTERGYLYDFGVNASGVCRLSIRGKEGQEIVLYHGEVLKDGHLDMTNIGFPQNSDEKNECIQKDVYICKGTMEEVYMPHFVYHGFRYVEVLGIEPCQAIKSLLEFCVMNSDLRETGNFICSDPVANELQRITRRSDLANFYYFPTDCPHREKNGWTGDAALSATHMLLNLSAETSLKEWLRNIRKAQADDGSLPGIVPTAGWGFAWGNGPVWDAALTWIPLEIYRYRGDWSVLEENACAIFRYLSYIAGRRDSCGLVAIGLGDWCPPGRGSDQYESPLVLTDSVTVMDIAAKASIIFDILGMPLQSRFASKLKQEMREAIRQNLIDFESCAAAGDCQTSQAVCLFYDVFDAHEKSQALKVLLGQIDRAGGHMTTGIIGGRVIFHVLAEAGYADLAYYMITRKDFPSYGNWIARGATSLWEDFQPEGGRVSSLNHHFWGDVSHWLIAVPAGIRINPAIKDVCHVDIQPAFINALSFCEGWSEIPAGKVLVRWQRTEQASPDSQKGMCDRILLTLKVPTACHGRVSLPDGWHFEDRKMSKDYTGGELHFVIEKTRTVQP